MFFDNLRRKTPAAALKRTTHRNASRLATPLAGRVSCQTSSLRDSSFHLRSNGPAHKRSSTPHQLSQIVISGASHRFPAVFSVFAHGEFRMAHRAYGAVSLLAKAIRSTPCPCDLRRFCLSRKIGPSTPDRPGQILGRDHADRGRFRANV